MPAAAVIPAPVAYIKVVAVKKLVVGFPDITLFGLRLFWDDSVDERVSFCGHLRTFGSPGLFWVGWRSSDS